MKSLLEGIFLFALPFHLQKLKERMRKGMKMEIEEIEETANKNLGGDK
jgi:hypothetical protein